MSQPKESGDTDIGKEKLKKALEALESLGVKLEVSGCGCCGSPWVSIEVEGEMLVDISEGNCSSLGLYIKRTIQDD